MKEYCKITLRTERWELEHGFMPYTWGEVTSKVTREHKDKSGNTYFRHFLKVIPTDFESDTLAPKNIHVRYIEDGTLKIDSLDEFKIKRRFVTKI